MFNIGPQELLLILLVALVVVGPQRLPELSRTIGRGLREFRKAQDEVKKTIRLGLDETEPTTRRGAGAGAAVSAAAAPEGASSEAAPGPAEVPPPDPAAEVARTLGRGLAEIRQARREIQRTFRVGLSDRPSTPARRPATATRATPVPSPGAPQEAPAAAATPSPPDEPEPAASEPATPEPGTPE